VAWRRGAFWTSALMMAPRDTRPEVVPGAWSSRRDQGVAPRACASCRHGRSQGKAVGRCKTMRRTERSTQTATLSRRSRNVLTWATAPAMRGAWLQRLEQHVRGRRQQDPELVGRKCAQLVRSSASPSFSSLTRFSCRPGRRSPRRPPPGARQVGHDEAGVGLRRAPRERSTSAFMTMRRLRDHLRSDSAVPEQLHTLARRRGLHAGRPAGAAPAWPTACCGHAHDVLDARGLQEGKEGLAREAPSSRTRSTAAGRPPGAWRAGGAAGRWRLGVTAAVPGRSRAATKYWGASSLNVAWRAAADRPGTVSSHEQGELLAVGGILGGVQVQGDAFGRVAS